MKLLFVTADPAPLFPADNNSLTAGRHAARLPALPAELQRSGHEVSIVAPFSAALAAAASGADGKAAVKTKSTGVTVAAALGDNPKTAVEVFEARSPFGLQVFLFKQAEHFEKAAADRPPIADDDLAAGALFAKLVVELARRLNPAPDIVQAQDWPGALALTYLRAGQLPFASVLTLDDKSLAAQGNFGVEQFGMLNLGWEWFTPTKLEFFGRMNALKGGVLAANAVVADGEGDRLALQTAAHGGGLDMIFREHAERLHGIPDGLDETAWNPSTDKLIPRKYRPAALGGKKTSANVFLASLELSKAPAGPVFILRRPPGAPPEHLDLFIPTLDQILSDDARLIITGPTPDRSSPTEIALALAAKKFPGKMALVRDDPADLDERFEHGLLAAADFELVLGRGRGVGAELVRGLRYGVVPIAPKGAGLASFVDDYRHDTSGHDHGHAFFFYEPTTDALLDAVFGRARPLLAEHPARWESMRQRAMLRAAKFNWSRTAAEYTALYGQLRGK